MDADVPKIVQELMRVARIGQAKFAKAVKVSQGTVSKWISGKQSPNKTQWDRVIALASGYPDMQRYIRDHSDPAVHRQVKGLALTSGTPSPKIIDYNKITSRPGHAQIVEIDMRAGMGGGGFSSREVHQNGAHRDAVKAEKWSFPTWFVREQLRASADRLIILETQGDSMQPTISAGDPVVVDISHKVPTPDGIYALRDRWGAMNVKRLQVLRRGEPPRILVISDNEAHSPEEVGADEIEIVGRVVCSLRRL